MLALAKEILGAKGDNTLVVADAEHFSAELIHDVRQRTSFDILVPIPNRTTYRRDYRKIPPEHFTPRWAGYATTRVPYEFGDNSYWKIIERFGERADDWDFKGFLSTTDRDEVDILTRDYPTRWHVEEFFNTNQALGWKRAGTQNLNIRYGQMTMGLIAQTVIHKLRERLGEPYITWDANHLAKDLFFALEGDVRVNHDTITITYYNAPNVDSLREHYEDLPAKLTAEGVSPVVPWLYDYKLDFRFR